MPTLVLLLFVKEIKYHQFIRSCHSIKVTVPRQKESTKFSTGNQRTGPTRQAACLS